MGTSLGAVIDFLVTTLPALCTAAQPGSLVVDGNTNDSLSRAMVYIGRTDPDVLTGATVGNIYPLMGTQHRIDETFTVDCFIDARADGTNQKSSRDIALSLYNVVVSLVATQPTLGGAIAGGRLPVIVNALMVQPDISKTAESRTFVSFGVQCVNRYQP
jgi:hypothetical protein